MGLCRQREIIQSSDKELHKRTSRYPFVKWAGGKTQLLPILNKHVPRSFNRYFEPFLGGGAMFFNLSSKEVKFDSYLSDINEELINSYMAVKNDVELLIAVLKTYESGYNNSPTEYYYKLRANTSSSNKIEMEPDLSHLTRLAIMAFIE